MSRNYDIKQTITESHAGYQQWLSIVASNFNPLQPSDIWFTELTIRRQAITWTNANLFNFTSIGHLGTISSEIAIEIKITSFKKYIWRRRLQHVIYVVQASMYESIEADWRLYASVN